MEEISKHITYFYLFGLLHLFYTIVAYFRIFLEQNVSSPEGNFISLDLEFLNMYEKRRSQ